ncbi:somatomedin-B and thrombospondin type-1 domain-containing protein-like isoform X1 [Heliangelus exortis]|uniref:somatomedin-B and thrombospondin type-1 domain-containing protein-like isoform X1 n=1 Tax=Heliangelus exortis TaxID=472823 RepID=UPI003A945AE5
MQSCSSSLGIKVCGSRAQCHRTARARGRGAAGAALPHLQPPISPSPVVHLPCSPPSILHAIKALFSLSFPSRVPLSAVGCAVGPWGPWSGCSSPCGVGSKARSRQVTIPPRHGGEPCPDLKQRRGCLGEHPTCGTAKEVAKILPDSFSQDFRDRWRRAGLMLPEEPSGSPLPSYCGYFRLTQVGPPCRGQPWSRRLHRDKRVCVECWGDTSHHHPHCTGHGLQGARTFWVAASVAGCQGSWVQEGLQEGCVCPPPALIFV